VRPPDILSFQFLACNHGLGYVGLPPPPLQPFPLYSSFPPSPLQSTGAGLSFGRSLVSECVRARGFFLSGLFFLTLFRERLSIFFDPTPSPYESRSLGRCPSWNVFFKSRQSVPPFSQKYSFSSLILAGAADSYLFPPPLVLGSSLPFFTVRRRNHTKWLALSPFLFFVFDSPFTPAACFYRILREVISVRARRMAPVAPCPF